MSSGYDPVDSWRIGVMVAQQTANLSGFVARRGSSPLSSVCVVEKVDPAYYFPSVEREYLRSEKSRCNAG